MTYKSTFKVSQSVLVLSLFITGSLRGQTTSSILVKEVQQSLRDGDHASLSKLIDSEEALWQKGPSVAYFRDMFTIGDILTGGTTTQSYWLGRKVIWKMLFKPVPREFSAAKEVYFLKGSSLLLDAEAITPYVINLSPEMFESARHDTFLMFQEYARQLHRTIIPGYRQKYSGAMNDWAERQRFKQNAVDNQTQVHAEEALVTLATDNGSIEYLICAYSHEPRNDDELKLLLDILNVQGADREKVMRDTR